MILLKNKSEFGKNALTLFTGQVLSQGLLIVIAPVLTRLYSPADFGVADVIMAIVNTITAIACGNYEQAILLPDTEKDAFSVATVSTLICTAISIFTLLVIILFRPFIAVNIGLSTNYSYYLYFVPILVWLLSLFMILRYYNLRHQNYKVLATATTIKSIFLAGTQLVLGFFKIGPVGLLSGQLSSNFFSNNALIRVVVEQSKLFRKRLRTDGLKAIAIEYINFPKFSVPGTLANTLVLYLPSIFISKTFTLEILGFVAMTNRILNVPLNVIALSLGDAFMQKLSRLISDPKLIYPFFIKTTLTLTTISLGFVIIGYTLLNPIILFVFGPKWANISTLVNYLLPLFAIRFVCSPISRILIVFQKQKLSMSLTILQVMLLLACFLLVYLFRINFYTYVLIFVISQSIFYLFCIYMCYFVIKKVVTKT